MIIRIEPNPDPDRVGTLITVRESLEHDGDMTFEVNTASHVIVESVRSNDVTIRALSPGRKEDT